MKVILCKPNEEPKVVELPKKHNFEDILRMLECEVLTCVERKIGNTYYDFWLDDEGLLIEHKYISGACKNAVEILCGNIVIALHDDAGNTIGLTDEQVSEVMEQHNWISNEEFIEFDKNHTGQFITENENSVIIIDNYHGFGAVRMRVKGHMLRYEV